MEPACIKLRREPPDNYSVLEKRSTVYGRALSLAFYNLVPRVFVPPDQWSENESSGSNHFEITKETTEFCPSGFTAQSASMAHA